MKKIGLLTYHSVCNFGANLQSLSTYSYFKNKEYDVKFINWELDSLEDYYKRITPLEQYESHHAFFKKYIETTSICKSDEDIAKIIDAEGMSNIIVGSDAVMQHHPLLSRISFPSRRILTISSIGSDRLAPNLFWGSFMPFLNKKVVLCMMSGSNQNSSYNLMVASKRKELEKHLLHFSYISTRDDWTSKMVSFITKGKIIPPVTPDPVFGFNYNVKNQPSRYDILQKFGLPDKYILLSFHNSSTVSLEWLTRFKQLASSKGYLCVAFPFPGGVKFNHNLDKIIDIPLSPLDWYCLIKYSSGYVGHNMHPIVVSLHNATPCFSFDNYGIVRFKLFVNEKSSKIFHIMNEFGLLQNRCSCVSRFYKEPDPKFVMDRLTSFPYKQVKSKSDIFLNNYLKMMSDIEQFLI